VELGLYGKRIEARTLKEMIEVLRSLEGVIPPDIRTCIRGNGGAELLNNNEDDQLRDDHTTEDTTARHLDM